MAQAVRGVSPAPHKARPNNKRRAPEHRIAPGKRNSGDVCFTTAGNINVQDDLGQLKIVVRVAQIEPGVPAKPATADVSVVTAGEAAALPVNDRSAQPVANRKSEMDRQPIPARMMNEFVYCPRLFYYEFVEGVIFYRATKQRVRLSITPELETWILERIAEAGRIMAGPIPAPLVHSPKCVRCSLAPVCLPDETRMLAQSASSSAHPLRSDGGECHGQAQPRRLIAARDDARPLYLNTPGLRIGCKDEVLSIKDKDKVIEEVRMRDVSHVALFGNIQISTQAIQSLCEQEVPITYFSMGGWFYGITRISLRRAMR